MRVGRGGAHRSGGMSLFCQASGTIIMTASWIFRSPAWVSSSATASKLPESDMSLDVIGSRSVRLSPSAAETSDASRERIWFLLPRSVLISPLWQSARKGCARLQLGNVLVEKRECTSARCDM